MNSHPKPSAPRSTGPRSRRWLAGGVAVVAFLAVGGNAIGSDGSQFECEEAAAHLADCCPGLNPTQIDCNYHFDCDGDSTNDSPEIDGAESKCIERRSCDELTSSGVCDTFANEGVVRCF